MLVHFKCVSDDYYKKTTNFKTVYFSNDLSLEDLSLKFQKLLKYFKEKSNKVNSYLLEDFQNEYHKIYSFDDKTFNVDDVKECFKTFLNLEWKETFKEPEIFMITDLIGWNFINAFIDKNDIRRFTFEKEGKLKQYTISSEKGEKIRRNYDFKIGDVEYKESKGTVWKTEFDGNIFEISQAVKGKVLDISCGRDIFKLKTEIGELSYEVMYRDNLIISESLNYFPCPYVDFKNELRLEIIEQKRGETIKIDFIKKRGGGHVGSIYGGKTSSDYEEFDKLLECYTEVANRVLEIANKTEDFKRVKCAYERIEDMIWKFPELDLSNLYLDFKQIKMDNDESTRKYNEKIEEEKTKSNEIKKKNNFSHNFTLNGVDMVLNSYVELYKTDYNYGKVQTIQLQVEFPKIYVESCLNWKYYKKYYILANIKVNSCHDKHMWSEANFKKIVDKLISKLKNKKAFEIFYGGESGTDILGQFYQLDDFLRTKYNFDRLSEEKSSFNKELHYNDVPKDKLGDFNE